MVLLSMMINTQIGNDYCLDAQEDIDAINVMGAHYEDVFLSSYERTPLNKASDEERQTCPTFWTWEMIINNQLLLIIVMGYAITTAPWLYAGQLLPSRDCLWIHLGDF